MSVFSMAGGNPALPTYPLQRSVRLRSSASAYFNKTLGSGSTTAWTWSGWVKRGYIGANQGTLFFGDSTSTNYCGIYFASDTLSLVNRPTAGLNAQLTTTQVFRDPSAWYHIVAVWDTANATSGDRLRLYVNGVRVTAFSTATYPALNTASVINTAIAHEIGSSIAASAGLGNLFDGYLEEINFIDGQALTASSFGAYNSYGVWSPAKYTGTYGTNGFYLSFQDNSSVTTTANVGIGADSSGNGNYWTSNNISLTAGVTYDSMVDVPTLTSPTNANYAVLNPLDTGSSATVANGNLSLTYNTTAWRVSRGTFGVSVGKWYWEALFTAGGTPNANEIGIVQSGASLTNFVGSSLGYAYSQSGQKIGNGTTSAYGATFTTNDIIGVAYDADAGSITFYKNNVSQGTAFTGITGEYFPAFDAYNNSSWVVNFGQRPFSYTPPTGFNRLNTYNLPDSIVPVGAQYFAATTYTGNNSSTGASRSLTNGGNNPLGITFQPDFVWIKNRSNAYSHNLYDSVRGAGSLRDLNSNTTNSEAINAPDTALYGYVSAFSSNGFQVINGSDATFAGIWVNQNAQNFVAWQWRASNASAVTNTAGSITSQVSANQTAGFSIVTYTGTGANATVGHGLGVTPRMVITKGRTTTFDWRVWFYTFATGFDIQLNSTAAVSSAPTVYTSAPSSTVINIGSGSAINQSAATYVAYCFAAVPGYSAFGSYTGNGSTDGPFVYLGFRPRWVMVKSTGVNGWVILDTSRSTSNLALAQLIPNLANAEDTTNDYFRCDILSNGFKLRTTGTPSNANGVSYIYAAFAENPFKNALAR